MLPRHAHHFSCLAEHQQSQGKECQMFYFFFFILKVKNKKKGALAVFAFLAVLLTSTVLQKLNDEEKVTIVKFIGVFLVCFSS